MEKFEYRIIRSGRKTVSLEISAESEIIVRVPHRMSNAEIELFVNRHSSWITSHIQKSLTRAKAHPEPDAAERERCIARAREYLPARVNYFASVMGLSPTGITITGAKTRFGSCSPKNQLCFSWRLMLYPDEAVDYVVVHELAHIVHKNHGRDFYALLSSVLPDHAKRRALLRE